MYIGKSISLLTISFLAVLFFKWSTLDFIISAIIAIHQWLFCWSSGNMVCGVRLTAMRCALRMRRVERLYCCCVRCSRLSLSLQGCRLFVQNTIFVHNYVFVCTKHPFYGENELTMCGAFHLLFIYFAYSIYFQQLRTCVSKSTTSATEPMVASLSLSARCPLSRVSLGPLRVRVRACGGYRYSVCVVIVILASTVTARVLVLPGNAVWALAGM